MWEVFRDAYVAGEEDLQILRQFEADWIYTCTTAWAALEPPLSAAEREAKRICAHHERNLARRLEPSVRLHQLGGSLRRARLTRPQVDRAWTVATGKPGTPSRAASASGR